MKYLMDKFSSPAATEAYKDGWERTFGKGNEVDKPFYRLISCGQCATEFYVSDSVPDDQYQKGCPQCDTTL